MPYIKPNDRVKINDLKQGATNAGELNYIFTLLCIKYLKDNGTSYQKINDIIGALEGTKLEFYRRLVIPYENEKIQTNGDVY